MAVTRILVPQGQRLPFPPIPVYPVRIAGPTGPTGPAGGVTVMITTAKLSSTGANGSMTFTNGLLTGQTQAL